MYLLGHSDIKMTIEIYTHLNNMNTDASEKLNSHFGRQMVANFTDAIGNDMDTLVSETACNEKALETRAFIHGTPSGARTPDTLIKSVIFHKIRKPRQQARNAYIKPF